MGELVRTKTDSAPEIEPAAEPNLQGKKKRNRRLLKKMKKELRSAKFGEGKNVQPTEEGDTPIDEEDATMEVEDAPMNEDDALLEDDDALTDEEDASMDEEDAPLEKKESPIVLSEPLPSLTRAKTDSVSQIVSAADQTLPK